MNFVRKTGGGSRSCYIQQKHKVQVFTAHAKTSKQATSRDGCSRKIDSQGPRQEPFCSSPTFFQLASKDFSIGYRMSLPPHLYTQLIHLLQKLLTVPLLMDFLMSQFSHAILIFALATSFITSNTLQSLYCNSHHSTSSSHVTMPLWASKKEPILRQWASAFSKDMPFGCQDLVVEQLQPRWLPGVNLLGIPSIKVREVRGILRHKLNVEGT